MPERNARTGDAVHRFPGLHAADVRQVKWLELGRPLASILNCFALHASFLLFAALASVKVSLTRLFPKGPQSSPKLQLHAICAAGCRAPVSRPHGCDAGACVAVPRGKGLGRLTAAAPAARASSRRGCYMYRSRRCLPQLCCPPGAQGAATPLYPMQLDPQKTPPWIRGPLRKASGATQSPRIGLSNPAGG